MESAEPWTMASTPYTPMPMAVGFMATLAVLFESQ
jgi:hypothetical protein